MNDRFSTLHDLLQRRRSGRAFSSKSVSSQDVERLLEAARWAPSCGNAQPWRFVAVTQAPRLRALHAALSGGNAWAKAAPVLIAALSHRALGKVAKDGRALYLFDTGMATQNLILQGVSMGLICHPLAGFDPTTAKAALAVPEAFEIPCLVAVGWPAEEEPKPRTRRDLEAIAAFESWSPRLEEEA